MNPDTGHPSYLELDRAALGLPSPELQAHLDTCDDCRAHVHRVTQPPPVPEWARALGERPAAPWRNWTRAWLMAPALVAAMLAGVVVLTEREGTSPPEAPYVGVKGGPAVTVYVKRGERVSPWDGQSPVTAGDRLRLHVSAAGYHHVTVGTRAGGTRWTTLYSGPLEKTDVLLPASWRVDGQGGAEELLVFFSQAAVEDAALEAQVDRAPHDETLWMTRLLLPKEAAP